MGISTCWMYISLECLAPYLGTGIAAAQVQEINNSLQEIILPETAVQKQQQAVDNSSQATILPETAVQKQQQAVDNSSQETILPETAVEKRLYNNNQSTPKCF